MKLEIHLKTSLQYLKGVGPERFKLLSKLGLRTIEDLLAFFPRRYEDRQPVKRICELTLEGKECVAGTVMSRSLMRMRGGRTLFKIVLADGKDVLFAAWFNQPYLSNVFEPKARVVLYGQAEKQGRRLGMVHPEYEILAAEGSAATVHMGRITPIYPLTEELTQKGMRQLLFRAVRDHAELLRDPLPETVRRSLALVGSVSALRQIHFPADFAVLSHAYRRVVFDEFFMMQTLIQIKKKELEGRPQALSHAGGDEELERLVGSLDFELTAGQRAAIDDIVRDMKSGRPMNRMLQGDVGSGKTAVAAAALAFTAANGFQGVLMAPTEVLAQQHYFNLARIFEPLGVRCGYLAQGLPPVEKESTLAGLASGEIRVAVGTHSLIQRDVRFKNLGLAVVDEQHKFGVFQRAALKEKAASSPHFLLMTATPIPRTLALTLYGDLDISTILERPEGRHAVKTLWVGEAKRGAVHRWLDGLLEKGVQAYVICPLIDEAAKIQAESAMAVHRRLGVVFSGRKVGLLHGRMSGPEKKKVMQDFKDRKIDLLVSTVVIEVGVDVPNANVMIIENAERFGLAQLHQLRGRVGRGTEEAFCVLFSDAAGEESVERLEAFQEIESGFEIAEKDLELRGAGDIVGPRQHGLPKLRIGDLAKDLPILLEARREAVRLVEGDPRLDRPEHRALRRAIAERFGTKNERAAAPVSA